MQTGEKHLTVITSGIINEEGWTIRRDTIQRAMQWLKQNHPSYSPKAVKGIDNEVREAKEEREYDGDGESTGASGENRPKKHKQS
jgi:hypothetical protein